MHISLDRDGEVYFEGKRTSFARLRSQLDMVPRMGEPEPAALLETEMGAPCASLDRLRALMNERLKCDRGGHCDEGINTVWRDLPSTGSVIP